MKTKSITIGLLAFFGGVFPAAAATVTMTSDDADYEHSFDTAGAWSDGLAPHAGADYLLVNGTDGYMRTPVTNISDSASADLVTFEGDSLTIGTTGTPGAIYDLCTRYARLNFTALHLVNGIFWIGDHNSQTYYQPANEQALCGTIYVESTMSNPFVFRSVETTAGARAGLSLRGPLVGDEDAAIMVTNACGYSTHTILALYADNPDYKGRFILDGDCAHLWPGDQDVQEHTFGATPTNFMKDAIILRHGAGFYSESSHKWNFKAKNRGIWVDDSATFQSQDDYTISMPIGGGQLSGSLVFRPHKDHAITVDAAVTCYPVEISTGTVILGPNGSFSDLSAVTLGSGSFGVSADKTVKLDFEAGTLYIPADYSSMDLPTLTLAAGSTWKQTDVTVRISAPGLPTRFADPDARYAILRVPTSVTDLSAVTFTMQNSDGLTIPGVGFTIETDSDGMQTLYVTPSHHYVVNPADRPSGHEPVAPYVTWATAATNIEDAVTNAVAFGGGIVFVDRGTYDITSPIPFAERSAKYTAIPIAIVGVDRGTMKEDPEHVILDGGYPARTNQLFTFDWSAGCAFRGLTMTHAANFSTDSNFGGGGAANFQYASTDFVISNCRFVENYANYGGALHVTCQTITNCTFVGNVALSRSSCIDDPQGNAGLNQDYLKVVGCTFVSNSVTGSENLVAGGRNMRFSGCAFSGNGSTGKNLFDFSNYTAMDGCTFEGNLGIVSLGANDDSPYAFSDIVIRNTDVGTGTLLKMPKCTGGVVNLTVVSNRCGLAIEGAYGNVRNFLVASNVCSDILLKVTGQNFAGKGFTWDSGTVVSNVVNDMVWMRKNGSDTAYTNIFRNCVFWDNRKSNGDFGKLDTDIVNATLSFEYCDVENGLADTGFDGGHNLATYPYFAEGFRLLKRSPLRDAGFRSDWMTATATDLAGNLRVTSKFGGLVRDPAALPDIGCYENQDRTGRLVIIVR